MQLSDALRLQIQHLLSGWQVQRLQAGERRAAAVALTVIEEGFGAQLPGFPEPAQ